MGNRHIEKVKNDLFEKEEMSKSIVDTEKVNNVVNALLRGEIVAVPDFGYLEATNLNGRRTVLFKSAGLDTPVMQQSDELSDVANRISDALKKGNVVSIPEIGIFRLLKKESGRSSVSFVLSSFLRKRLNGEEIQAPKEIPTETIKEEDIFDDAIANVEEKEKSKAERKEIIPAKPEVKAPSVNVPRMAKKGDVIIPNNEVVSKKKNCLWLLLLITAVIAFLILAVSIWFQNKKEESPVVEIQAVKSVNLPYLAEQNYGNPVFWVYIYDANQEKLTSPVNIPEGIELIIPDLKKYNVDVTDSMEIKLASMKAEVILKQINSINNLIIIIK
ncbi:MAG: hypothetical protein LBH12_06190 [Dysgonamonadaceae bacterium]|jgi:nucleoid DNA-binding protein|nr:hypothetical protein [Dysgonamonadaceae bacterium]